MVLYSHIKISYLILVMKLDLIILLFKILHQIFIIHRIIYLSTCPSSYPLLIFYEPLMRISKIYQAMIHKINLITNRIL